MAPRRRPLSERFWEKVQKSDGCWLWKAGKDRDGYGQISNGGRGGKMWRAHVLSFVMHNGPVPDGLQVNHTCHVRACVRPDHLYAGTPKQNAADCKASGNYRNPNAGKERCKRGHLFTDENTYIKKDGGRQCLDCLHESKGWKTRKGMRESTRRQNGERRAS